MAASSSSDPMGQATQEETPGTSTGTQSKARGFAAAWASKLGQKASELKNATKDAMQQTKEAFAAEAKMVAKDMVDLKEGVAEGMRLTVQDTSQLRERIGQQTRKVFASKDATQSSDGTARPVGAGEEEGAAAEKKSFFGPETTEHLKGKVQDLKAGGKKAAEKVRDVGGKLWHKTDHWFHQLRGDSAKEGAMTRSWEECHQHALQLYESGVESSNLAWTLEELKTGTLQVYAKSAVIFHHPNDQAAVDELFKSSSRSSQCAAPSTACIAAYCQTPLRTENQRCDVHIFSFSQSFLDISSMDQAKRQVLRDKLKWLCYTVSVCASQHQLSIAWHLPGGAADVSENDSEVSVEGLQELCKMMMKDQLKAFPEVDLTTRLPDLHSYFDSPGFEETASSTLFVHLGEPWHGAPPLGVFGSCTALTLLCRPTTHPCLNQVLLTAPEDSSMVAPAADVVASAGLDLLDVAEDSAPPMDPMDPVAVVIGDDLELDEDLGPLNAMSLASGVFYLLLCLWLAMYASISAQSFGTRLLTQFVRLPTASQYNVAKATATAVQYEDKDLSEMLRVPIIQAGGPSPSQAAQAVSQVSQEPPEPDDPQIAGSGVSFLGRLPSRNGLITNPSYNILPAAMLDHIRLYRRVQLNWQAYDAYARVSLFCGANSLLYSCLYWALGSFLTGQHAGVAAVAVALVFATIQVMLAKLDLRLRSWHLRRIACLLGCTPVTTTLGMFLYADLADSHRGPFAWQRLLMNFCALTAHVLHTIVAYMVLMAAWPDDHHDEEALLPGKFRSTLYLDVFGWLLNPTGPGPRRNEREDDDDEVRSMRSFMGSRQDNVMPPSASPPSAASAASASPPRPVSLEAVRPKRSRWDSASVSFRGSTAESSSRTSRRTSRTSLRVPGVPGSPGTSQSFTEGATQRLLETQRQSLWQRMRRSFNSFGPRDSEVNFSPELEAEVRRTFPSPTSLRGRNTLDGGSQVDRYGGNEAASIEDMHAVNDPAADTAANFMGREAPRNVSQRKSMLPGQRPWNAFKRGTQIIVLLWSLSVIWALVKSVLNIYDAWKSEKAAALRDAPQHIVELPHFFTPSLCAGLQDELQRSSHVLPWSSWAQAKFESPVLDAGCGWDTAEDVSLTCDAASCTAALLQRGGRNVTLCTAIPRGGQLTLTPLLSWTLTSGASPLRNLALQIQGESLHIYAATHQDGLLLLRPRGEQLRPVLEVETSKERGSWTPELLLVLKDVLFSFRPEDASCEGAGLLTAWQLNSGVKFQRVLSTEAALNMTFCSPSVVASF